MSAQTKRSNFLETPEGIEAKRALEALAADSSYNTESSYNANIVVYPDNIMPFVDKHMEYLYNHPATNPKHYISNLRLKTRIK